MNGKNIELTRRRVLGGLVTVGAASAAAGAGTFAYFSDSETSENNTVTAGDLTLSVNDGDGFSYSPENIAPGENFTVTVDIENTGSIDASNLVVTTATDTDDDANLAEKLDIDEIRWGGDAVEHGIEDPTVEALVTNDIVVNGEPANSGATTLAIDVTFNQNANNDYQDVSVDVTHTFTLYQDSSQI